MSKYLIEKNIPIPTCPHHGVYQYKDVPFDQLEVGDCISIPIKTLIPNNTHPDTKERARALGSMGNYLKRKFPEKKFVYRADKPIKTRWGDKRNEGKEHNLNRCVRVWRIK